MEIWIDAFGWEGFYEVSNIGRVRSRKRTGETQYGTRCYGGGFVKPISHKTTGYLVVNLTAIGKRKQVLLHRLVLLSFIGPPGSGNEACHNNGNRHDPKLDNLRWDSRKNNNKDKIAHGTLPIGEKNGFSKLTLQQAQEIKKTKTSIHELAKRFGVSASCCKKVRAGETWMSV